MADETPKAEELIAKIDDACESQGPVNNIHHGNVK